MIGLTIGRLTVDKGGKILNETELILFVSKSITMNVYSPGCTR